MVDEEWIAITCGTNPRPSLTALGAHCKYFNIPLYVARYGTVWGGWMTKLQVAEEIVKKLHPDTMIAFIDAYDVICNGPIESLRRAYAKAAPNKEILLQQDKNCHPNKSLAPFLQAKHPGRTNPFPCAGISMGPAWRFRQIFAAFPTQGFTDDQHYWCDVMVKMGEDMPVKIDFDHECSVMWRQHSKYDWKELEDKSRVMVIPGTNKQPVFVHLAGNDKFYLPKTLKQTRRRGVPGVYKYPVLEGFILLCALFLAFMVATIVLSCLLAKERRCARKQ